MAGYLAACHASIADPITDPEVEEAPYWQGICDGLREGLRVGGAHYGPNASLAVIVQRDNGEHEYFGCNGVVIQPTDAADVTFFVHHR